MKLKMRLKMRLRLKVKLRLKTCGKPWVGKVGSQWDQEWDGGWRMFWYLGSGMAGRGREVMPTYAPFGPSVGSSSASTRDNLAASLDNQNHFWPSFNSAPIKFPNWLG
ncbi:hypothetical protein ACO22_03492 [Paracoccidioides brasiliensis]|uniref:Uncharacterized protein n=1 Tax=Paracoccidioides brasiliensis TaxID=121759 RepID=A0A1D2JFT0_PARBR|nr:hypothetical protein ACO22_03492 [Paracoccidioides brasiliensis]